MELTWSTFILEIINFLVLVWLLKRFLYQPVLEVIARRRAAINAQVEEAHALQQQAEAGKAQYENRLADWERERAQAQDKLHGELEAERAARLEAVAAEIAAAREKALAVQQHQQAQAAARLEQEALDNAARFAARLLQVASGPELERALVELALTQLASLDETALGELRQSVGQGAGDIAVNSAYPLDGAQREALCRQLATLFPERACRFGELPELLAGLCITAGGWRLGLNLRDELQGFARAGAAG